MPADYDAISGDLILLVPLGLWQQHVSKVFMLPRVTCRGRGDVWIGDVVRCCKNFVKESSKQGAFREYCSCTLLIRMHPWKSKSVSALVGPPVAAPPFILGHFEMCGAAFQSKKSLRAPGGINCRVSSIDQALFKPSADTLWQ